MLLKGLTQNLRRQNWFAAALDVCVVILGIFLGLQATEWNEQRKRDNHSKHIELRISANLKDDVKQLSMRLVYWQKTTDYGEFALAWLEGNTSQQQSHWEILLSLYQASNLWRFSPNRTTYDELVSAGNLSLIRNESLREDISQYYSNIASRRTDILYDLVPEYRIVIREAIPYSVGRMIHDECQVESPFDQALKTCQQLISEEKAEHILQSLSKDENVISSLRYWMNSSRIGIDLAHLDIASAQTLSERFEQRLTP